MTGLQNLLDMQITMLILLLAGFLLVKTKVMSADFRKALTDFIIAFILPCNIIKSFLISLDRQILADCMAVFLVSCGVQVLSIVLGHLLFSRAKAGKREVLFYGTQVSNAGFLGNPIVEGLYGAQGLLYASVYLIPLRVLMWSLGVACFSGKSGKGVIKKLLTHPCIAAVAIGLVLMLTQPDLPVWLRKPLEMTGGCNTALSLLVIGGVLGELDAGKLFTGQSILYCAVRLVLIPLLVLGACLAMRIEPLVTQVAVVLAGMPAALTTAMLAGQYGKDAQFAVSLVFLSTIGSMVTVPLLCLLMMGILS